MWQQEKKDSSIVSLALWLALATTPMAATVLVSAPLLAQSPAETPSFAVPQTVKNGTIVRIDGSSTLNAINQSLKENFEKQFSDTKVEVAANGTDAALKALLNGKIDIAAIGRGLTPQEKAQGLEQVRLRREKVAIIVGAENPFNQSLTSRQFARIFRGTITDWSEVNGTPGKIRVIDHPAASDTRENFRDYPAFKSATFATGANATAIPDDNTTEIVKKLGKDGISYVLANQVSKLQGVKILRLHQTLPDDPKYPFSQPLVYVYKKNPSPGIASFLGFTLAPPGQKAIEQARTAQAEAIATNISATPTQSTPATTSPIIAETTPVATATPNATAAPKQPIVNRDTPFWLLLPLLITAVGGILLWWLLGRRASPTEETNDSPEASPSPEDSTSEIPHTIVTPPVNEAIAQTSSKSTENLTPVESKLAQSANNNFAEANVSENNVLAGAALANGTALATGAAIRSTISDNGVESQAVNEKRSSDSIETNSPRSGEAWDIEAPAAVVNTSYPHLPNIPEQASDVESPSAEVTDAILESPDVAKVPYSRDKITFLPELPEISDLTVDFWDDPPEDEVQTASTQGNNITASEETEASVLFNIYGQDSETNPIEEGNNNGNYTEVDLSSFDNDLFNDDLSLPEDTPLLTQLPDLPEDDLDVAAESTADLPEPTLEEDAQTAANPGDLAGAAALVVGAGIGAWATINNMRETTVSEISIQRDPTVEDTAAEQAASLQDTDDQSSIVLTPRSPTAADVAWQISDTTKTALQQQGGSQLAVRLYDVTGIDLSYQSPQLVQQYESEQTTNDRSMEIPVSDRDYIAEIGYLTADERWLLIARSAIVRVFSPVNTDTTQPASLTENLLNADDESSITITPRSATVADVAWQISDTKKTALQQQGGSQLAVRLYDVTGIDLSYQSPQLVQQYESEQTTNDRSMEIPVSDRDYIAEIGYLTADERWLLIARSAIVRVFSPIHTDTTQPASLTENLLNADDESIITITPRSATVADVAWQISDTKKTALQQQGGSQLAVRLYDVTGIDLSYQSPQLLQQYESEQTTNDRSVEIPVTDRDYIAEIGYLTADERWLLIARSAIVRVFSPVNTEPTQVLTADLTPVDTEFTEEPTSLTTDLTPVNTEPTEEPTLLTADLTSVDTEPTEEPTLLTENLLNVDDESIIVLTPRSATAADVAWQISDTTKTALQQQGGSQLVVRLYDVTEIDLSYQSPQLVQQYECDRATNDRSVEIPVSDRDYIAEIGYLTNDERWLLLARSAIVRVFSPIHTNTILDETQEDLVHTDQENQIVLTPRTPKWAYVCWHVSESKKQALRQQDGSQLVVRLYDVTEIDLSYQNPQLIQQYECEEVTNDRFVAIPASDRDYIAEIGYVTDDNRWLSIARSAIVRVFSPLQENFWFVADAELIIHGATPANATVSIGNHTIKVKPDGTFHLRIPFSDGLIDYLITVAADGQHSKTIRKKFLQETSES